MERQLRTGIVPYWHFIVRKIAWLSIAGMMYGLLYVDIVCLCPLLESKPWNLDARRSVEVG